VEFHVYYHPDAEMRKKLDAIVAGINTLLQWRTTMSAAMDALIVQVTKNSEVEASAILLIQGIAQQLKDAIANGADPIKLAELTTQLDNSAQALAAAVAANTPVAPA
jgi:hypothetical protein